MIVILENFLTFFLHSDYGSACVWARYITSISDFHLLTLYHVLGRLQIDHGVLGVAEMLSDIERAAYCRSFCVNFQLSHVRWLLLPFTLHRALVSLPARMVVLVDRRRLNSFIEFFVSGRIIVLTWTLYVITTGVTRFEFDWSRWSTNDIFSLEVIFITAGVGHNDAMESSLLVDNIWIPLPRLGYLLLL